MSIYSEDEHVDYNDIDALSGGYGSAVGETWDPDRDGDQYQHNEESAASQFNANEHGDISYETGEDGAGQ